MDYVFSYHYKYVQGQNEWDLCPMPLYIVNKSLVRVSPGSIQHIMWQGIVIFLAIWAFANTIHIYKWTPIATVQKKELMLENIVMAACALQNPMHTVSDMDDLLMYHTMPIKFPIAVRKSATLSQISIVRPVVLIHGNQM